MAKQEEPAEGNPLVACEIAHMLHASSSLPKPSPPSHAHRQAPRDLCYDAISALSRPTSLRTACWLLHLQTCRLKRMYAEFGRHWTIWVALV